MNPTPRPFRTAPLLSAFVAALLSLAACEGETLEFGAGGAGGSETGGAGPGGSGASGCSSHAACTEASGYASICRKDLGLCVQLQSEDCTLAPGGDYQDENSILVGVMLPFTGPGKDFGPTNVRALHLAVEEINKVTGGIPDGPNGAPRPLAYLACDEQGDVIRAGKHLIDDLGVPAIVGPAESGALTQLLTELAVPKGVLVIAPFSTSAHLASLPDDGLLWRLSPSDALQALALARSVAELEAEVRSDPAHGLAPGEPIRVALAFRGDAFGASFSQALAQALVFNGKSAAENGSNFLSEGYDPNGDFSTLAASLVGYQPHVLVTLGFNEVVAGILAPVEFNWKGSGPKPEHLLSSTQARSEALLAAVGGDDELRQRIRGTRPASHKATEGYASFVLRHKQAFGPQIQVGPAAEFVYDATYLLGYAIFAAGSAPKVDGKSLAVGMGKLSSGDPIQVAPDDLTTGFSLLAAKLQMDLEGTSGHLDFDAQGEVQEDFEVWCIGRDASGEPVFRASGQTYDAQTGTIEGSYECP